MSVRNQNPVSPNVRYKNSRYSTQNKNLSDRKFLGLAWCIFLSDRMSDKFKKFSRSLRIVLSMKQNAGRVGFKCPMASMTSLIRPNIHRGPSSYFKYMTNIDLVLMKKSLFLLPKGSFTWNIDWKIHYEAHLLASLKRQVDPYRIRYA